MNRLEKTFWGILALLAAVVAFWTVTLPEDEGRRLWNDHDPLICAIVGSALLALCLVAVYRTTTAQRDR